MVFIFFFWKTTIILLFTVSSVKFGFYHVLWQCWFGKQDKRYIWREVLQEWRYIYFSFWLLLCTLPVEKKIFRYKSLPKGTVFLFFLQFCIFLIYLYDLSGEYMLQWYSPVQFIVNVLPIYCFCKVVFDNTIFILIIVTFSNPFFFFSISTTNVRTSSAMAVKLCFIICHNVIILSLRTLTLSISSEKGRVRDQLPVVVVF